MGKRTDENGKQRRGAQEKIGERAENDVAERKKPENEIHEREAMLDALVNANLDIVMLIDITGKLIMTNESAAQILGREKNQMIGDSIYKLLPEGIADERKRQSDVVVTTGKPVHFEDMLAGRIMGNHIYPVFDDSARVTRLAIYSQDVTERKRAGDALRLTNEYNRRLIEAGLDPLVTIGPNGKINDVNHATEVVTGCSRKELIGTDFSDYFTDPERARAGYRKVYEEGQVRDYELEIKRRDGHVTPVLYNASVYRDEAGEVIGLFAAARDITERKRMEEALRVSEEKLIFALRMIHTGGWDLDLVDHTAYRTLEHDRIFGYDSLLPQWTFEMFLEHVLPEDRAEVERRFNEATAAQTDWNFECRIRRVDGEVRWIWATGGHQRDAAGQVRRMAGIVQDITERKRIEESLRENEFKYRMLFENAQVGMYRSKIDGSAILDVNRRFADIFGFSCEELIGAPGRIRWARSEDRDRMMALLKEKGGILTNFEVQVLAKNDEVRDVLASIELHPKEGFLEGTMLDVTELKKAQQAVRESEDKFKSMVLNLGEGFYNVTLDGRLLDHNIEFNRILGIDPKENLVGAQLPDFWQNPEERKAYLEEFKRHGSIKNYPIVAKKKNGEAVYVEANSRLIKDEQGKPVRIEGTFIDVTARRMAEEEVKKYREHLEELVKERTIELTRANEQLQLEITERKKIESTLRQEEGKFRAVFDESPIGKSLTLPNGRLSRINRAFAEMLGYPIAEMSTLNFAEVTHPDDLAISKESIRCLLAKEQDVFRFQKRYIHKDGHIVWTSVSTRLLRDSKDEPLFFITNIEDITERKRTEEALKELNELMKQRNFELEAANKELEAFAYSVSHDLRAPLRTIDGFSQAVLEDHSAKLDEQGKDYLQRMRTAAQRMAQLIDDILQLSRVTRAEMKRERTDMSMMARNIAGTLRKSQPERQVEVEIAQGLVADCDPHLLRIVLDNLLGNAWKFTGRHPSAKIEFGIFEKDGEKVYFVRDDGAGFDMKYVKQLFTSFQRLHSTSEFPGTGIGLAMVSRIIHRHGGRIWAEGKAEEGATFYFTLNEKMSKETK